MRYILIIFQVHNSNLEEVVAPIPPDQPVAGLAAAHLGAERAAWECAIGNAIKVSDAELEEAGLGIHDIDIAAEKAFFMVRRDRIPGVRLPVAVVFAVVVFADGDNPALVRRNLVLGERQASESDPAQFFRSIPSCVHCRSVKISVTPYPLITVSFQPSSLIAVCPTFGRK